MAVDKSVAILILAGHKRRVTPQGISPGCGSAAAHAGAVHGQVRVPRGAEVPGQRQAADFWDG